MMRIVVSLRIQTQAAKIAGRHGPLVMNSRRSRELHTVVFFLIAYLISWTAWITLFARHLSYHAGSGFWLYLVAVLGPHASAVVITAIERGRPGLRAFYRLVFRRVPLRWAIVAISVPPIVYLTRDAIAVAFHLPHTSFFHDPQRTLAALIFGQLAVALGEEPGWRGFALPQLIEGLGPVAGTLILGTAWALWHLPLFLVVGTPQHGTPFVPFLIELTAWSMVITIIVMHARGSTVAAMLFHASGNLCAFTMWEPDSRVFALWPWVVATIIASWRMRVRAELRSSVR
jgi:membrane protease YdiL (CAAX protease family)